MACSKEKESQIREDMKEYYGKTIQNRDELLINNQELEAGGCREESKIKDQEADGCREESKIKDQEAGGCREESKNNDQEAGGCPLAKCKLPRHVTEALAMVHPDVKAKSYGCGLPVPELLEGCHVLDLGSGAGHDCFTLAKLVGETGHVTGVDMTEEQLDFARRYNDYHREALGYSKPNTEFVRGYIENLGEAGLRDNTFDVIISNCTVNLSPDKKAVFGEAYRVLKPGGEMYFSDMYADRVVPDRVKQDKVMWGEGFAGALWWEDLVSMAGEVGFSTPRLVKAAPINVKKSVREITGDVQYVAATYRLFKVTQNGNSVTSDVTYNGSVTGHDVTIALDKNSTFQVGSVTEVDPELSAIIQQSRFASAFTVVASKTADGEKTVTVNPFAGTTAA